MTAPKDWIEHFFALHGFGDEAAPMADALVDALKAAGFEIRAANKDEER
jgi:hypothetical protein